MYSDCCPVCNVCFWTTDRLLHHLTRSRCGAQVEAAGFEPLDPETVRAHAVEARRAARGWIAAGRPFRFAARPPVKAAGPLHPLVVALRAAQQ